LLSNASSSSSWYGMIDNSCLEGGAGDGEPAAGEDESKRGGDVVVSWGGWQAMGDGA
jgi:hypothetical protein